MRTTDFPTPFARFEGTVLPGWIDGNGHMNLAYYVLLFDQAVDLIFDELGFGAAYREAEAHGPFAVETHTLYERELLAGARVRVTSRILAVDAKRLHLAHEMYRAADGARAATQELMFLHVDLAARRAAPFTPGLRERLDHAAAAHHALPRPDWVGRRVTMPPAPREPRPTPPGIAVTNAPSAEDCKVVMNGLAAFNRSFVELRGEPLAALLRDEAGTMLGGLLGHTSGGWFSIDYLWLPEAMRGKGVGRRLIAEAEAEASRRGCVGAHVNTGSFQAPVFTSVSATR